MRKPIRDDVQELALVAALDQIIEAAKSVENLGAKVKRVMRETKDAIGSEREVQGFHESITGMLKTWADETGMLPITLQYLVDDLIKLAKLPELSTADLQLHEALEELLSEVHITGVAV